jgi:hypothetical protein
VAKTRSGVGRYFVIIIGLVLTLGGVACLALFLTAAGAGAGLQAVVLAIATLAGLGGGMTLLTLSARRRGGMLDADPTPAERRTYWARYRHRLWRGRRV